jgi:hypothetical protein
MAIRFDNSADYIYRNSGVIDFNAPYTVAFWGKISVDRNDHTSFLAVMIVGFSALDYVAANSDGTTNRVARIFGSTTDDLGTNLVVGTWYHFALVANGSALDLYLNGVLDANISHSIAGRSAANWMGLGSADSFSALNGCVAYARAWTDDLSQAEIEDEINSTTAVRTANLWADWPLEVHTDLTDVSGNGRGWTASGTLTTEDGPELEEAVPTSLPIFRRPLMVWSKRK